MNKEILTINPDVFNNYCAYSCVLSLLCSKDVLSRLEHYYSKGFVNEEDLLNYIYGILKNEPFAFINDDSRIEENLDKIIQNGSSANRKCINDIKIFLNLYKHPQYTGEPFLRMNYIWRKYGFDKKEQVKRKHNNVSNQFLINHKEQIYDSIAFDFDLILAFKDLGKMNEQFFESCLNNYRLFASINYFRLAYPDMLNDLIFLSLMKSIAEFKNLTEQQQFEENCFFDDFKSENKKFLKYINKRLKHL